MLTNLEISQQQSCMKFTLRINAMISDVNSSFSLQIIPS